MQHRLRCFKLCGLGALGIVLIAVLGYISAPWTTSLSTHSPEYGIRHGLADRLEDAVIADNLTFSSDGRCLAGWSGTLRVWSMVPPRPTVIADDVQSGSLSVFSFTADSQSAVSGERSGEWTIWDIAAGKAARMRRLSSGIQSMTTMRAQRNIIFGCMDGAVRIVDGMSGEVRQVLQCVSNPQAEKSYPVVVRANDKNDVIATYIKSAEPLSVVSNDTNWEVVVWDVQSGKRVSGLLANGNIADLAFCDSGSIVVVAEESGDIAIYNYESLKSTGQIKGDAGAGMRVECVSSTNQVISWSCYGSPDLSLWSIKTHEQLQRVRPENGNVVACCISLDDKWFAAGALEKNIFGDTSGCIVTIYRIGATLEPMCKLRCQAGIARAVQFSPDSALIAVADSGRNVIIWDVRKLLAVDR